MKYRDIIENGRLVLHFAGKFTYKDADIIDLIINEFTNDCIRFISIDMSMITHIDDAALGMLLYFNQRLVENGGLLTIENPIGDVTTALFNAKINELIHIIGPSYEDRKLSLSEEIVWKLFDIDVKINWMH